MSKPNAAYEGAPESWVGKPVTFTLEYQEYFSRWVGRLAAVGDTGVVVTFGDPAHPLGDPVFVPWGALVTLSPAEQNEEQ